MKTEKEIRNKLKDQRTLLASLKRVSREDEETVYTRKEQQDFKLKRPEIIEIVKINIRNLEWVISSSKEK